MTHFCIDTSAWHRSGNPTIAAVWRHHLERDELAICDQVRLEILYSARSARDYASLAEELGGLPTLVIDAGTFVRALQVQQILSGMGGLHHRSVKIADLIVAAAAEAVQATVLHYDADFDTIAQITSQPVQWIAPPGSL